MTEERRTINSYEISCEAMTALGRITEYEFWAESTATEALFDKIKVIDEVICRMECVVKKDPSPNNTGVLDILKCVKTDMEKLTDRICRDIDCIQDIYASIDDIYNREVFDDDDLNEVFKVGDERKW